MLDLTLEVLFGLVSRATANEEEGALLLQEGWYRYYLLPLPSR